MELCYVIDPKYPTALNSVLDFRYFVMQDNFNVKQKLLQETCHSCIGGSQASWVQISVSPFQSLWSWNYHTALYIYGVFLFSCEQVMI